MKSQKFSMKQILFIITFTVLLFCVVEVVRVMEQIIL